MASSVKSTYAPEGGSKNKKREETKMSGKNQESLYDDDFDFVEAYDEDPVASDERMLPENDAVSAISCAFLGIGGGGVIDLIAVSGSEWHVSGLVQGSGSVATAFSG